MKKKTEYEKNRAVFREVDGKRERIKLKKNT